MDIEIKEKDLYEIIGLQQVRIEMMSRVIDSLEAIIKTKVSETENVENNKDK